MKKRGKRIGIYLSEELLHRLDEICDVLPGKPARSGIIEEGILAIIQQYSGYPGVKEKLEEIRSDRLVKRPRVVNMLQERRTKNSVNDQDIRPLNHPEGKGEEKE